MQNTAKIAIILGSLVLLFIILVVAEGIIVGREFADDATRGCCCGQGRYQGKWYTAPTSHECESGYAYTPELCGTWACGGS